MTEDVDQSELTWKDFSRKERRHAMREVKREEKARRRFEASPTGEARTAYSNGALLFQTQFKVSSRTALSIPLGVSGAARTNDPNDVLNAIANQGWELVSAGFVFEQSGAVSRDKFMSSGQEVRAMGDVWGYYVFRRCPDNRDPGMPDAADTEEP